MQLRLHTCSPTDSVGSAVQRLANMEVGQLVCVDATGAMRGVVTSSDLLTCFLDPRAEGGGAMPPQPPVTVPVQ